MTLDLGCFLRHITKVTRIVLDTLKLYTIADYFSGNQIYFHVYFEMKEFEKYFSIPKVIFL